jgi:hypothetical protein
MTPSDLIYCHRPRFLRLRQLLLVLHPPTSTLNLSAGQRHLNIFY